MYKKSFSFFYIEFRIKKASAKATGEEDSSYHKTLTLLFFQRIKHISKTIQTATLAFFVKLNLLFCLIFLKIDELFGYSRLNNQTPNICFLVCLFFYPNIKRSNANAFSFHKFCLLTFSGSGKILNFNFFIEIN